MRAQTRVDLRTQSKGVDFSGAGATKPFKSGDELPASCGIGETFFRTTATAGENLYLCTPANTWSQVKGGQGGGKLMVAGAADEVQAVIRGYAEQTKDLAEIQQGDGRVVARVDKDGFIIQGIGTTGGYSLRVGNPDDSGASAVTVFGGDGAGNSEPGYYAAYGSDASRPFASYLFPCNSPGSWCASSTIPSIDSNDILLSSGNGAVVQNKSLDRSNSVQEYLDWYTMGTPLDNPATGVLRVYAKDGGGVCWKDSNGVETCAGAGGAGGAGVADPGSSGLMVRTGWNESAARAILGSPGKITVTNGDGQAGDPVIAAGGDLADKTLSNTYAEGAKQIFRPSPATAGYNLACAALPSAPEAGDLACDSVDANKLKQYDGNAWVNLGSQTGVPGGGTVTSVGLSAPAEFTVSGSPVIASGTLSIAWAGQEANRVLAGPSSGGKAAPSYRQLTGDDLPAATFYTPGGSRAAGWGVGGANQIRAYGFVVGYPVVFSHIMSYVTTADTTGCSGSGCVYTVGIYDATGALVAHAGPQPLTTVGTWDAIISGGESARLNPGRYYYAFTGTGSTAALTQTATSVYPQFYTNGAVGNSSGGVLPSTLSFPADTWTMAGHLPYFALR